MKKADIKIGHYYRTKTNEIVVVRKIENKPTVYHCVNSETKKKSKFSVGTAFIEEVTESNKVTRVTKKEDKPNLSHVLVKALAGTGKTTTLIQMLKMLRGDDPCCLEKNGKKIRITPSPQQEAIWDLFRQYQKVKSFDKIIFCAFNKAIADVLAELCPPGTEAATLHSIGNRIIRSHFNLLPGQKAINSWKTKNLLSLITGKDIRDMNKVVTNAVDEIVGHLKLSLVSQPTESAMFDIVDRFSIDIGNYASEIFDLSAQTFEKGLDIERLRYIDFNDMVSLPSLLNLPTPVYNLVAVDEAQDMNKAQQSLALKLLGYDVEVDIDNLLKVIEPEGEQLTNVGVFIGDPNQAIYGFAGADSDSMPNLGKTLSESNLGCVERYLTVTRRCGKAIVREAAKIVPSFEAHDSNQEGLVTTALYEEQPVLIPTTDPDDPDPDAHKKLMEERFIVEDGKLFTRDHYPVHRKHYKLLNDDIYTSAQVEFSNKTQDLSGEKVFRFPDGKKPASSSEWYLPSYRDLLQDGDMVLCRVNAPLIQECFKLLKEGRKANIQGRDIGQGLIKLIDSFKVDTSEELLEKVSTWSHKEKEKELRKKNPSDMVLLSISTKEDCIVVFASKFETVTEIKGFINNLFTDKSKGGILMSSFHKSKGLEAKNVYLLLLDGAGCPHPMAKSEMSIKQEWNLLYVAETRAIDKLTRIYGTAK